LVAATSAQESPAHGVLSFLLFATLGRQLPLKLLLHFLLHFAIAQFKCFG
jgi:hypothetical protein